jgi:hypothetical protein
VPELIESLRSRVEQALEGLGPIDFGVVVGPVIELLEENTAKLRQIDPSSLNDVLRAALATALDVVIDVDFTGAISDPLKEQFAAIKAVPQLALDELQERYELALGQLDALAPSRLLEPLFEAFDAVEAALGGLGLDAVLAPLDQLHEQHLVQPLAGLRPSTLLAPLASSFQGFVAAFDDLDGASAIAPLDAQLGALKAAVAGFDATGWVDELLAAVERLKQRLREAQPSRLLEPLAADFDRLLGELDRFKPSVLFAPATELAGPLLQLVESVQQSAVQALFDAFQVPLSVLDRLRPQAIADRIRSQIDALIAAVSALRIPARFNQLKGEYFDLSAAVRAGGVEARIALVETLDPQRRLGAIVDTHNALIAALERAKENVLLPDLEELYGRLRERLLGLLPPYARELLDAETFKRVMRLADPTRFLQALDERFEVLKGRLIPVQPREIAAELDAVHASVLGLVDGLDLEAPLRAVREIVERIKGLVATVRIDFLAADVDRALADVRALVSGLDVARLFPELDALHADLAEVVAQTRPSAVLAGLGATLDDVQAVVSGIDPRTRLEQPLNAAWEAIEAALAEVDIRIVLSPLVDKLDELEVAFEAALGSVEAAFDEMLGAGRSALGGASASAGASL